MPLVLLQRSRTHSMNVCEKHKRFVNFSHAAQNALARIQAG